MNDNWIFVSDRESSDSEGSLYSDRIDSDIEAELYSAIHHDADTSAFSDISIIEKYSPNNSTLLLKEPAITLQNNDKIQFLSDSSFSTSHKNKGVETKKISLDNNKNSNANSCSQPLKKSNLNANSLENIHVGFNTGSNLKQVESSDCLSPKKQKITNNAGSNLNQVESSDCLSPKKQQITNNAGSNTSTVSKEVSYSEASDSEGSVILIDPDMSVIHTNVKRQAILVSSDSDSYPSFFEDGTLQNVSQNENLLKTNSFVEESSAAPWHINVEDLYRRRYGARRYHDTANSVCANCNTRGHLKKDCTERKPLKCFLCGGNHMGTWCRNRICGKCLQMGHGPYQCHKNFVESCDLCQMNGHSVKSCPDMWRRYHLTTSGGKIKEAKPINRNAVIYCFNCGAEGHYGATCPMPRMSSWCFPTWTTVLSYTSPSSTRSFFPLQNEAMENSNFNNDSFQEQHRQRLPPNNHLATHKSKKIPKSKAQNPKFKTKKAKRKKAQVNLLVKKQFDFPRTPKQTAAAANEAILGFQKKGKKRKKKRRTVYD